MGGRGGAFLDYPAIEQRVDGFILCCDVDVRDIDDQE